MGIRFRPSVRVEGLGPIIAFVDARHPRGAAWPEGRRITNDPAEYFFRFESSSWLVADRELVKSQLLEADETTESAVGQLALDFIKTHATSTSDTSRVLATSYEVYAYLFREEHLADLGLPQITAEHLGMLREAATLMALNKVELDGHTGESWGNSEPPSGFDPETYALRGRGTTPRPAHQR